MFELLIIVVIVLLVFGAGKVRSAGSDLGAAVKGFRKSLQAPPPAPPTGAKSGPPDPAVAPGSALPDAEFPEVLAARSRGSSKPGA
jgi:TatA/E family protein of Tat protein translocase